MNASVPCSISEFPYNGLQFLIKTANVDVSK